MEILRFADAVTMPWANGTGTTREIARGPGPEGAFAWRISVADVTEDGPFSRLPGVDRVIALCEGSRMLLVVGEERHELRRWTPFAFSGDDAVRCEVPGGPTRDLNVMTRRGYASAVVERLEVTTTTVLPDRLAGELLCVVLDGVLALGGGDSRTTLRAFDTLRIPAAEPVALEGTGLILTVEISTD